jgi:molybdopterin converting factor small subunit
VITVRVRTIGLLKSLISQGELDLELPANGTVQDVLDAMARTYGREVAAHLTAPVDAASHPPLRVTVNGRDIGALDDRRTVLADGDDVLVLTPIAGG